MKSELERLAQKATWLEECRGIGLGITVGCIFWLGVGFGIYWVVS